MTEEISEQLSENLAKLPAAEKVSMETGELSALLASRSSDNNQFDVIYIQSDRKQADYLEALATQAWRLLKPDGLMFFKDYQWRDPDVPSQSAKLGIDAFIEACVGWDNVLHRSHQVIVKKESELSA